MISSLPRFLIKKWDVIVTVLVAAGLVFMLFVNKKIFQEREVIVRRVLTYIPGEVTFGNIFYILPNKFVLTDITIRDVQSPYRHETISIPALIVYFSPWELFSQKNISVSAVKLARPFIPRKHFLDYLRIHQVRLEALLAQLPEGAFTLVIENGIWHEQARGPRGRNKTVTLKWIINKNSWNIKGWLREDMYYPGVRFLIPRKDRLIIGERGLPFKFSCEGFAQPPYLILDYLDFKQKNFYARLWGQGNAGQLQLEGYAFAKAQVSVKDIVPGTLKGIASLQIPFKGARAPLEPNVFILDIRLLCRMMFPAVEIEKFSFSVNEIPIQAQGKINFDPGLVWDGTVSFAPAVSQRKRPGNFQRGRLKVRTHWQENIMRNAGDLTLEFANNDTSGIPLQKLQISFADLSLSDLQLRQLELGLRGVHVLFYTSRGTNRIQFDGLKAFWAKETGRIKYIKLFSPFYGGGVEGRIWVDTDQVPFKVTSVLELKNVDTHILDSFLVYFAKVYGRLDGKIDIKDTPVFQVKGAFSILDGRLHDMAFFKWLADTFSLPSLRDVVFKELSSDFFVSPQGQGLDRLKLKSPDVTLDGYFHVNPQRLVSSKISMDFSRVLLGESPKFAAILKRFDKPIESLTFDFQMSGDQDALNFKWLQTKAKDRIQEIIPDFIERRIERGIDSMLEPAPKSGGTAPPKNE